MVVVPAINCTDASCAQKRLRTARTLGTSLIHLDVVDGEFAPVKTWGDPQVISEFHRANPSINFEIHLMVKNPDDIFEKWLVEGVERIIVHVETIRSLTDIEARSAKAGKQLMLALKPETPISFVLQYASELEYVQLLAVAPGFAGQDFKEAILEKTKFLKKNVPTVRIEIDGGVNARTIKGIKEVGADIVVSASHIFGSFFPRRAYKKLVELAA